MDDPAKSHNYRILLIIGLVAVAVATVWVFILQIGKPAPEKPAEASSTASYALALDNVVPWGDTVANKTTKITSGGSASPQPTSSPASSPTATPVPTPSPSPSSSASPSSSPSASPTPSSTPSASPPPEFVAADNTLFSFTEPSTAQIRNMKVLTVKESGKPVELKKITEQFDMEDPDEMLASWNGRVLKDDDIVGTGTILELIGDNGLIADTAVVVVPGDVTGSGQLDDGQLALLKEAIDDPELLKGAYFLAGDLDSSGKIDIADLRLLAQAID